MPEQVTPEIPNCPLVTGLRPCMCEGRPRCPECNYSDHDAAFEMDHSACKGRIPEGGGRCDVCEATKAECDAWLAQPDGVRCCQDCRENDGFQHSTLSSASASPEEVPNGSGRSARSRRLNLHHESRS